MRVLVASKRAPGTPGRRDGGVQTWVATIAAELYKRQHEVIIADQYAKPTETFDIGIFANSRLSGQLRGLCKHTVLVSHGIVPDEEPIGSFDTVLFTSEQVRDFWQPGTRDNIVRQPLDLDFWKPRNAKRRYLQRFANRSGLTMLPDVAVALGMEFQHLRGMKPEAARDAMQQALCVVASGRCAIEAMACGAPVVICDDRHYQGALLDTDTLGSMQRNYSGRGGVEPTANRIKTAIENAMVRGDFLDHIKAQHDVGVVVDKLLDAA